MHNMQSIKSHVIEFKYIDWQNDLQDFQPQNIKVDKYSNITKQSIIDNGFTQAIHIWQDPADNVYKIMDGHNRRKILLELQAEGYQIPEKLPCNILDNTTITTEAGAFTKYWLTFNQKINPINQDNLMIWAEEFDIQEEALNLQEYHIDIKEEAVTQENNEKNKEVDIDKLDTSDCKIVFKFDPMMYESVLKRLNTIKEETEFDTKEAVLLSLLENYKLFST